MKTFILLVVGLVLTAAATSGADISWGRFKLLNSKVKIMGSVGRSTIGDTMVPNRKFWLEMGPTLQIHNEQISDLSVGIAPLPGNRQQVTVYQTTRASALTNSQSYPPWTAPMVDAKMVTPRSTSAYLPIVPKRGK